MLSRMLKIQSKTNKYINILCKAEMELKLCFYKSCFFAKLLNKQSYKLAKMKSWHHF